MSKRVKPDLRGHVAARLKLMGKVSQPSTRAMNPLACIYDFDFDDPRLAAAKALDGLNAESPVSANLRVYELSQLLPLPSAGRGDT